MSIAEWEFNSPYEPSGGMIDCLHWGWFNHHGHEVPSLMPFPYFGSIHFSCQAVSDREVAKNTIENLLLQVICRWRNRFCVTVYQSDLEANFPTFEACCELELRKDATKRNRVIFGASDLQLEITSLCELCQKRRAGLAARGFSHWADVVDCDPTAQFHILVLDNVADAISIFGKDELSQLVVHGAKYGILVWLMDTFQTVEGALIRETSKNELQNIENIKSNFTDIVHIKKKEFSPNGLTVFGEVPSILHNFGAIILDSEVNRTAVLGSFEASLNAAVETVEADHIVVEVGRKSGQPFEIRIGPKSGVFHSMLAGGTGKGKTVLLKHFISQCFKKYSPTEFELDLVDCKDGGDFFFLEKLAHVAYFSKKSDGIQHICDHVTAFKDIGAYRNSLFEAARKAGMRGSGFTAYNAWALENDETTLPFRLLIVDEAIEMFRMSTSSFDMKNRLQDSVSTIATSLRSSGMSLMLCSQSFASLPVGVEDITSEIPLRMSLQMDKASNCRGILAPGNFAAFEELDIVEGYRKLLVNYKAGRVSGNEIVDLPLTNHEVIDDALLDIAKLWGRTETIAPYFDTEFSTKETLSTEVDVVQNSNFLNLPVDSSATAVEEMQKMINDNEEKMRSEIVNDDVEE